MEAKNLSPKILLHQRRGSSEFGSWVGWVGWVGRVGKTKQIYNKSQYSEYGRIVVFNGSLF